MKSSLISYWQYIRRWSCWQIWKKFLPKIFLRPVPITRAPLQGTSKCIKRYRHRKWPGNGLQNQGHQNMAVITQVIFYPHPASRAFRDMVFIGIHPPEFSQLAHEVLSSLMHRKHCMDICISHHFFSPSLLITLQTSRWGTSLSMSPRHQPHCLGQALILSHLAHCGSLCCGMPLCTLQLAWFSQNTVMLLY